MNYTYYLTAAETMLRNAKSAEERGYALQAVQYFKSASKKYRQAADVSAERRAEFLSYAEDCDRGAERNSAAAVGGAVQAQKGAPGREPAPAAAPKTAPKTAPRAVATAGGESKQKGPYEGYALDISDPNEKTSFDDIIGLEEPKRAIHDELIYPLQFPEMFSEHGLDAGGKILLEGPPGTGKTTFAKAVATEVKLPFINVNCNALVDSYIGKTGQKIDAFFEEVRRFVKEQDTAIILFCDEFDAIAKKRSANDKTADESVPTLIKQLEGYDSDNKNIMIIAATNLKSSLDTAILSRFTSIYIPLPDASARRTMFLAKLKKSAISDDDLAQIDLDRIAAESEGLSGRKITQAVQGFMRLIIKRDCGISPLPGTHTDALLKIVYDRKNEE